MKKIIFISENWFIDKGGRRTVISHLINGLSKEYKIVLVTVDKKGDILNKDDGRLDDAVKKLSHFIKKDLFFLLRAMLLLRNDIKRVQSDIIICSGSGPHANAFLLLAVKLSGSRAKTVIIDQINPIPLLRRHNVFVRWMTRVMYRKVNACVAVSRQLSECTQKLFNLDPQKNNFIYNGVDVNVIREKTKQGLQDKDRLFFSRGVPVILTVARLDSCQKDFMTLFQALYIVNQLRPCILLVVGDGPDREKIRIMTRNCGVENSVFFIGYRKNPYLFMAQSDAFILSSFYESFGLVLIEAMICGCPVVSSDCDFGPREIIKDGINGFLVPVGDEQKMAEKITQLLEDENLREKFVNNSQKILKKLTLENSIEEYKELFKRFFYENRN